MLSCFEFRAPLDENGNEYIPPLAFDDALTSYVVPLSLCFAWCLMRTLCRHAVPFKCKITPRSTAVIDVLRDLNESASRE